MKQSNHITINCQDVDLEKMIAETLEKLLAPVVETICEMERVRRKEYLTEKEVALLFSLSVATLKTQRNRGGGPAYKKLGNKVLYARRELESFLK